MLTCMYTDMCLYIRIHLDLNLYDYLIYLNVFIHIYVDDEDDPSAPLRPVSSADFKYAILKLKASVDDSGKELQKVHTTLYIHTHKCECKCRCMKYVYVNIHFHI